MKATGSTRVLVESVLINLEFSFLSSCSSTFDCLFVLVIVFPVLRFKASDYTFGIFNIYKRFKDYK